MLADLREYTEPLSRTPAILRAVTSGQPDSWLDSKHAEDVASPRRAVAHLLICEAEESWIVRFHFLLDPEIDFPLGPYAGLTSVDLVARPLTELLDEFESYRIKNLRDLEAMGLTTDDLEKGVTEEGFGRQTVANLLATWVAHDLYHLGQIFKSYSAQYIDRIGPYQQYLNLPHFN